MKRSQAGFTLCGVLAGFVAASHAEPVYVSYEGTEGNLGRGVAISLSGGMTFWDGSTSKTLWAGQRTLTIDGEQVRGYSAELTNRAGTGWHDEVAANDALGGLRSSAIETLFAANEGAEFASEEEAVAFQALLWEIMYDFDGTAESLDLHSGHVAFGMVDASIFAALKSDLSMRGGSDPRVTVIASEVFADHFRFGDDFRIVPLPSAAGLAGLGMLGLASRRRRL